MVNRVRGFNKNTRCHKVMTAGIFLSRIGLLLMPFPGRVKVVAMALPLHGEGILYQCQYVGGATFHAFIAGCTFVVIHYGNTVDYVDGVKLTGFFALETLYTTHFTVFDNGRFVGGSVGTESHGTFSVCGNFGKKFLGTYLGTHAASGTFCVVYVG